MGGWGQDEWMGVGWMGGGKMDRRGMDRWWKKTVKEWREP